MTAPNVTQRNFVRFAACNSVLLKAQLTILKGEGMETIPCELSDISSGGCAVKARLNREDDMTVAVLKFHDDSCGLELEVAGKLCWQQQTSLDGNTFGFRFRRPIDDSIIEQMVDSGLVTRRQGDRVVVDAEIQARRTHGRTPIELAILEDCSPTGLRLTVDVLLDVGERLLLSTQSGSSGSVSVVWATTQGNQFQCGCRFTNLQSARTINEAMKSVLT